MKGLIGFLAKIQFSTLNTKDVLHVLTAQCTYSITSHRNEYSAIGKTLNLDIKSNFIPDCAQSI